MDYRFEGKRKTLSFGSYPAVGLKDARARHEEAKKQLAAGIGPAAEKKRGKVQAAIEEKAAALTFEAVARDWFSKKRTAWTESHQKKILSRLENQLFPHGQPSRARGIRPHADIMVILYHFSRKRNRHSVASL